MTFGYNKNNVANVVNRPVATIIISSGQGSINLINSQKFSRLQILISGGIIGPKPCSHEFQERIKVLQLSSVLLHPQ